MGVGGDDAIADGSEGDLEPVPPVEDRVEVRHRSVSHAYRIRSLSYGLFAK